MIKLILLSAALVCYCLAAPLDDPELKSPGVLIRPAPINPDVPSDPRPDDKIIPISDPEEIKKYKRQIESEGSYEKKSDSNEGESRGDGFLPGPVQITPIGETVYGEHYEKKRDVASQVLPVSQQPSNLPTSQYPGSSPTNKNNPIPQTLPSHQINKRDVSSNQKKPVSQTLPKQQHKRNTGKDNKDSKKPVPQTQQKRKRDSSKDSKKPVPQTLPAQQKHKRNTAKDNKDARKPVPQTLPAQQKHKRNTAKDNKDPKKPVRQTQQKHKRDVSEDEKKPIPQTLPKEQHKRDTVNDNKETKKPVPQTLPKEQHKRDVSEDEKKPIPQTLPKEQHKRDTAKENKDQKSQIPQTLPSKHQQHKRDVSKSEAQPDPKDEIKKEEQTHEDHVFPARFPQKERKNKNQKREDAQTSQDDASVHSQTYVQQKETPLYQYQATTLNKQNQGTIGGPKPLIRPLAKRDIPVPTEPKLDHNEKSKDTDSNKNNDDKTEQHPATVHRPISVSALFNNNNKKSDEKKTEDDKKN